MQCMHLIYTCLNYITPKIPNVKPNINGFCFYSLYFDNFTLDYNSYHRKVPVMF